MKANFDVRGCEAIATPAPRERVSQGEGTEGNPTDGGQLTILLEGGVPAIVGNVSHALCAMHTMSRSTGVSMNEDSEPTT